MILREFETEERLTLAETEYLKRRGITKVGHHEIFRVRETENIIEFCSGSAMRYYYKDGHTEEPPANFACIDLPKELISKVMSLLEEINPDFQKFSKNWR
jgi:hypothetical protein